MMGNLKISFGISVSGIVTPFALGVAASKALYDNLMPEIKPSFTTFTIFTGVAMSITAFPVLARILIDRELLPTRVGQVTLAAAAVDDAAAWCLLLVVIALVNNTGNYLMALWAFLVVIGYALFLFLIIRPLFTRHFGLKSDNQDISQATVFVSLMIMAVSAFFTNALGVDAIFGGFLAGLTMPHEHGFAIKLASKFEDLVSILFLPLVIFIVHVLFWLVFRLFRSEHSFGPIK
jgi:Kef-type K+ transport system membrane component KefB